MIKGYDLIIIGAGAAGLSAAIAYKRACHGELLIIEVNPEAGRKILATGNGKCNLTNTNAPGFRQTKEFFESLGVMLDVDDEGRVYPHGRQASVVRDILYEEARTLGAEFLFYGRASGITRLKEGFAVSVLHMIAKKARTDDKWPDSSITANHVDLQQANAYLASNVIVATGGKAGPQFGSTGDGYKFARDLNIDVYGIRPGLVPLLYDDTAPDKLRALKGVRARAVVRLLNTEEAGGAEIAAASGEIQFSDTGLSGICIFDLSLYVLPETRYIIEIDLTCGRGAELPDFRRYPAGIRGIINSRLAEMLTHEQLTAWRIPVRGTRGWRDAQVTVGGVSHDDLEEGSYMAKNTPGLYFAGEVLDYTGICGGYNLDNAWTSGIAAGTAAAVTTAARL